MGEHAMSSSQPVPAGTPVPARTGSSITEQAWAIANKSANVGFPIALLVPVIEYLLPMIIQCWALTHGLGSAVTPASVAQLQEQMSDIYDPQDHVFHQFYIRLNRRNAAESFRKAGQSVPDRSVLDAVTTATLEHFKSLDLPAAVACCREAIVS